MDKNPSTILIADDEPAMREALGELLVEEGYEVEFAKNGTEAMAKAREIIPDLVLLDVMMPDIDGFAACRSLRTDKLLAQVPIIMITSLGDRASRLKGFEAGADDYVSKPIDEPELLARVKTTTHLNRYRKLLEEQISREMAEEALQISETRYRQLFDRVPVGLYRSTPDGETLEANQALIEMLGYPDVETFLATNATEAYVDPRDRQRWQAEVEQEEIVLGFENQWRRYDGTTIWVQENARIVRDEEGQPLYYEGSVEDITERVRSEQERARTEQELQKREAHQALVLSSLPMAFYTAQPYGDYGGTWVSGQIDQVSGFTAEQFLEDTRLWAARLHPEDRDRALDTFKKLPDTETLEIEYRWQAADGEYLWLLDHAVLTRDENGTPKEIIGTWLDITERKQAEEALQHSLQRASHGQLLLLALSEAAQAVQRARAPQEVYQTIGEEIAKLGYQATIFNLTEDGKHLTVGYMTFESDLVKAAEKLIGLSTQDYRVRLTPGGFYERLISEGAPVFSDPGGVPLAEALPKVARPLADKLADLLGIHQAVYVPLKVGNEVHALLTVMGAGLTEDDIPAMTAFASQAAIAIENAQLYEQVQARSRYLETMQQINATLRSTLPLDHVLDKVARGAGEALGYVGSLIVVPDEAGERLIMGAAWGGRFLDAAVKLTGFKVEGFNLPLAATENPMVQAYLDGKFQYWSGDPARIVAGVEPAISPKLAPAIARAMGAKGAACVPLIAGERVLGVLVVFPSREHLLDEERTMLLGLADQAGLAIQNAQLYQTAQQERDMAQKYLDIAGVMLVAINTQGEITLMNRKGCDIIGCQEGRILGKNWFDTCLPSEIRKTVKSVFDQLIAGEIKSVEYYENPVLTKSGEQRLIAWHNTVLRDQAGNIVGTLSSGEDITERRQAEEAYRALVDHSLQGLAILQDGRIVFANQTMAEIGGYTTEELLALSPEETQETIHPEDREAVARHYRNQLEGKSGPKQFAFRAIKKDRTVRWLEAYTSQIEYQGRPAVQTAYVDITERVRSEQERAQAEEALRESEERFRYLVENMPIVCFTFDREGRLLSWNRAAERIYGYTKEEAIGASSYDLIVTPETKEATDQVIQAVFTGQTIEGSEWQDRNKAGQIGWRMGNTFPLLKADGSVDRGVNLNIDITERKQIQEALRESEERHRTLFETMTQGVLYWDAEGRVVSANPAAERILGLTLNQIQGKAPIDPRWKIVHQDGSEIPDETLLAIASLRAGEEMRDVTIGFFNPEIDSHRWVNVNAVPLFRPGEDIPYRAYTIFEDITERVQAEAEIKQRNEELAALNEIGQAIVSTLDLQETLTAITHHTTQLMGMAATSVALLDEANDDLYFAAASGEGSDFVIGRRLTIGQGVAGWVIEHGQPVLIPDVSRDDRWDSRFDTEGGFTTRSILCVPLKSKGRIIGALEAINKEYGFSQDDLRLLNALVAPVSTAIENARLFEQVRVGREQLQTLSRRLVEMQEAERAHVARELHDETGQALSSMLLNLGLLEQEADQPEMVITRTNEMIVMVDDMLENLHRLAMNLRPATLDHLGLVPALEQYVETFNQQYRIKTQFEAVGLGEERLLPEVETALYRIVQESLTNVVRHAQATQADVLVERRNDEVVTIVEDNGAGFDPETAMQTSRLGLLGMRERAEMLNGKLVIESAPGAGTTVLVEVPYKTTSDLGGLGR